MQSQTHVNNEMGDNAVAVSHTVGNITQGNLLLDATEQGEHNDLAQSIILHAHREAARVQEAKTSNSKGKGQEKRSVKKAKTPRKCKVEKNLNMINQQSRGNDIILAESINERVQQVKVHELNPIRRAKQLTYDKTGLNNPKCTRGGQWVECVA